ncbi:PLD nuclease N-terminal domain-containing protein [Microbacterium hominis]|uniref:PLD nuclease N-terminal domain-containing protein n=1 Tax=Microbacterium hominis TaxID=162426 RepID=UPI0007687E5E|nr:PLD nuclease N-terminal domain-containing protein [Microbacterium hominis]KXC05245.1 hypothetical protein MhomT_11845 [Microbacterium hominis]
MVRILLPLALLLIAFWVYSIVDCALQPPTRHRGVSKPVWILLVVLLPIIGGVMWFVVGRGRPQRASTFRAPDDNPDFLGSLGAISIADQDERIRRLEAELAALDSEGPEPDRRRAAASARASAPDDDPDENRRGSAA